MGRKRGGRHRYAHGGTGKDQFGSYSPPSPPHPTWTETGKAGRRGGTDSQLEPQDGKGEEGDFPGNTPTPEDLELKEVYRGWVHANAGDHLHGVSFTM